MSVLDTVTALYDTAKTVFVNKVIDLASNTLTGTTAQFNAAVSDGDFPVALAEVVKQTANYTAGINQIVPMDATSGVITATFPTAPVDGSRVVIKKVDSSANAVNLALGGSDVFNLAAGATTGSLQLQNQALQAQYDAAHAIWYVISTDVPLSGLDGRYATTGVTAATASTTAKRDAQGNLSADAFIPGFTPTTSAASTTTLTVDGTETQQITGSTTQLVVLPTTGVVAGQRFKIINSSTGAVTVNASAGGVIIVISSGVTITLEALVATPTLPAHWAGFTGVLANVSQGASGNTMAQRDTFGNLKALCFIPNGTTTATAAGTTVMNSSSTGIQIWTGATTQTITLPTTNIAIWQQYQFMNRSSGALTINSSAGTLVKTLAAGASSVVTALQATPTAGTHWDAT